MNQEISLEGIAKVVHDLQEQLVKANNQIAAQQNALNEAANSYQNLRNDVYTSKPSPAKLNKPEKFKGKGSIKSWCTHMDNYLRDCTDTEGLALALIYLSGPAHEWWIAHQNTENWQTINTWSGLKIALITRFEVLDKEKIARDKLAHWKQLKDVSTFNEDFQKIILDIPSISTTEKIDRYCRGLMPYIWKDLCTNDYNELSEIMTDAQRIEAAHKRLGSLQTNSNFNFVNQSSSYNNAGTDQPTPMEIGNIELKKLTPEERDECIKKALCLRCRQPGHIAKNCPKGRRD